MKYYIKKYQTPSDTLGQDNKISDFLNRIDLSLKNKTFNKAPYNPKVHYLVGVEKQGGKLNNYE